MNRNVVYYVHKELSYATTVSENNLLDRCSKGSGK